MPLIINITVPLFIFAATVCRFIGDYKIGNPNTKLRRLLIGRTARERDKTLRHFRILVSSIIALASLLFAFVLARLLRIKLHDILNNLNLFYSVLSIPPLFKLPIRLLYLSFRDFFFNLENESVNSVAFSRDGQLVASASWNKTAKVWDAQTGQEKQTLAGHSDSVTSVAFSRDGQLVASASHDKTVKVWDAATGQELQTINMGTVSVILSFSPDFSFILTDIRAIPIGCLFNYLLLL
ncbi:hypothetical protein PG997_000100 [Apiospora hydei]|uniref:Uncharacterized protein n=1 Tax=Apiospora hydei TaxID=1337664 RepID=A0ABR1X9R7_9PEZI